MLKVLLCIFKFVFVTYTLILLEKIGEYFIQRIGVYVFTLELLQIKHLLFFPSPNP